MEANDVLSSHTHCALYPLLLSETTRVQYHVCNQKSTVYNFYIKRGWHIQTITFFKIYIGPFDMVSFTSFFFFFINTIYFFFLLVWIPCKKLKEKTIYSDNGI